MPPRSNPFPGPRSFQRGEQLYGRDKETEALLDLLIAERIILLYSPSGAGKTSLLHAGLIPALEDEGFCVPPTMRVNVHSVFQLLLADEPSGFHILPAMRVNAPLPDAAPSGATNRYTLSCLLSLEEARPEQDQLSVDQLAGLSLDAYLARHAGQPAAGPAPIDPTGKLLAATGYDNAVYLWRLPSLRPLGRGVLVGHTRPASSVAFHPNGKLLASSSLDGSIILWDVETQQQIGSPLRGHGAPVNAVAFSRDGRWLASGGNDNAVILWPITSDAWVDIACRIVGRSLTAAEVEQYFAGRPARACVPE